MDRDYSSMSRTALEELRGLVLDRIAQVPQFRRGSLQVGYRKCGRKTCRCAKPGEKGHGPRGLWTRTVKGKGGSRGQYIPVEHVVQVQEELENYAQFADLVEDYVEINEELCKARLKAPPKRRVVDDLDAGEKKGGPVRGTR